MDHNKSNCVYQANKQIALCSCCKYFFNQENFSKLNYFASDHSIGFLFCPIFTFWNQMHENIRQKSSNVKCLLTFSVMFKYFRNLGHRTFVWSQALIVAATATDAGSRLLSFKNLELISCLLIRSTLITIQALTLCTGSKYNT